MIFKIEVSRQAENDLRALFDYIDFTLQELGNAISQLNRLEENIMNLEQMPERFRKYEKEPWHRFGLRSIPVGSYTVLYIPNTAKQLVTIIRVMYGRQAIDNQIIKYNGN